MKLNDTVYKKIHCAKSEFTLYSTSLLLSDYALMIPKQVTEGFICSALAQQNSSGNNRYRNEKHSMSPLETELNLS
jgi:hypothetical protein